MGVNTELTAKLIVLPGSPDLPETVTILCTGIDPNRDVEFLTNGVVHSTMTAWDDGRIDTEVELSAAMQVDLADIGSASVKMVVGHSIQSTIVKSGTGEDSIELRYKA